MIANTTKRTKMSIEALCSVPEGNWIRDEKMNFFPRSDMKYRRKFKDLTHLRKLKAHIIDAGTSSKLWQLVHLRY